MASLSVHLATPHSANLDIFQTHLLINIGYSIQFLLNLTVETNGFHSLNLDLWQVWKVVPFNPPFSKTTFEYLFRPKSPSKALITCIILVSKTPIYFLKELCYWNGCALTEAFWLSVKPSLPNNGAIEFTQASKKPPESSDGVTDHPPPPHPNLTPGLSAPGRRGPDGRLQPSDHQQHTDQMLIWKK